MYMYVVNNVISSYPGALYQPSGAKEFSSGDRVKCDLDMEILSLASAAGDGADEHVLMVSTNVYVQVYMCMCITFIKSILLQGMSSLRSLIPFTPA